MCGTTEPRYFCTSSGMVLHRLRERHEDDAQLAELLPEGRRHRHAVEHGVDGDAGEQLLLVERDAELVEGRAHLGIDFVEAVQRLLLLRRRVVDDVLVVDRVVLDVLPASAPSSSARAGTPSAATRAATPARSSSAEISRTTSSLSPLGIVSLVDVGDEAVLVFAVGELFDGFVWNCGHERLTH